MSTLARRRLYRKGAKKRELREFQRRYGAKKGAYIYGATVGKVKRERKRKNARKRNIGR